MSRGYARTAYPSRGLMALLTNLRAFICKFRWRRERQRTMFALPGRTSRFSGRRYALANRSGR